MTHTPGQWRFKKIVKTKDDLNYYIISNTRPNGITNIGRIILIRPEDEADANARLMCMAPVLLAELINCVELMRDDAPESAKKAVEEAIK